jgi:uncharacterized protein YdiU (UPF0061 family)
MSALRRLRRVETDDARRHLAEALARETALAERDAVIERELNEALRITGDFDRQAFSAWLGRMRTERAVGEDASREAEARTAAARAALARRRVAETAAEEALSREMTALEAEAARREQVMLEDTARALRRAAVEAARRSG